MRIKNAAFNLIWHEKLCMHRKHCSFAKIDWKECIEEHALKACIIIKKEGMKSWYIYTWRFTENMHQWVWNKIDNDVEVWCINDYSFSCFVMIIELYDIDIVAWQWEDEMMRSHERDMFLWSDSIA